MKRSMRAAATGAAAVLLGGAAVTGCSSDGSPSPAVSSVLQSAQSAIGSAANSAASGLASAASSALTGAASSALAGASSALAGVKGGLDAKTDVTLGSPATDSDGKVTVPVTVVNHGTQPGKYTIQVNFDDASGNLLDAAVVTVPETAVGATAQATARSNRTLTGTVTPVVANAVRY
ncbi:hypothetical protein AB0K51_22775 [Kitasatospora sp. NPDC049285]|uniref:hypothetical protein n=1 Tax=Kitasatospora sp. NPDC049285 TaxID=3157096 RepID=UPI0034381C9A